MYAAPQRFETATRDGGTSGGMRGRGRVGIGMGMVTMMMVMASVVRRWTAADVAVGGVGGGAGGRNG